MGQLDSSALTFRHRLTPPMNLEARRDGHVASYGVKKMARYKEKERAAQA